MSYLDFVRLFSSPATAFVIMACIVAGFACLFFSIGHGRPAAAANHYWTRMSFIAEMCVGVGLIGLALFAGRMKLSADHQLLEERVRATEAAVAGRLGVTVLQACTPAQRRAGAPFNPAVASKELCAIARTLSAREASDADWTSGEQSLRDFASKYPGCVPNVFSRHSDCEDTVVVATHLADHIAAVRAAKLSARSDEAMAALLEAPNGWQFLLLAYLIAALGVGIKCARAACAFCQSHKSERRHTP
jgi:hypothetical protein